MRTPLTRGEAKPRFAICFLGLAVILTCSPSAQAQVDLAIVQADAGNFLAGAPNTCSPFSPQFSNSDTYVGPIGTCVSTVTLWVVNKGASTAGPAGNPIVVTDALTPVQPKGSTILSANGFCAFPGGCANLGGAPAPAANGWNCNVTQGNISCNRNDVLAAGQVFPPIVIRVTREDFSPLSAFSDVATVSGGIGGPGNLTELNPADNTVISTPLPWPPNPLLPFLFAGSFVTVHSVPEGLSVRIDGSWVTTPHTDFWLIGQTHSIDPDEGGTPFPGNAPWIFSAFSTGGLTLSVHNNVVFSTFPPNLSATGTWYEQVTAIYHK
jgi:hypothetical protein